MSVRILGLLAALFCRQRLHQFLIGGILVVIFLQPLDDVLERPFTAIKDINTFLIGLGMESFACQIMQCCNRVVPTTADRLETRSVQSLQAKLKQFLGR
jgi:hypothetical protein